MPKLTEFFALSISLIKRDGRGTVKIAETVSPLGWESIANLVKSNEPSARKLIDVLNRLRQRLGESGNPKSFEEAVKVIEDRTADARADELQELLQRVRRNDPSVGLVTRDDYTTGVRIVMLVTQLPQAAHADKARKANAIYEQAFSMLDEPIES